MWTVSKDTNWNVLFKLDFSMEKHMIKNQNSWKKNTEQYDTTKGKKWNEKWLQNNLHLHTVHLFLCVFYIVMATESSGLV